MTVFSNINIGKRLGIGFSLVLLLTAVIAATGIWRLNEIADSTRAMMSVPLQKERLMAEWNMNTFGAIRRTAAIAKSSDPSLAAYFKQDGAATAKRSTELLKQIEALLSGDEEKALFRKIAEQRKVYTAAKDGAVKARTEGRQEDAERILDKEYTPAATAYQEMISELVTMQQRQIDQTAKTIDEASQRSTWMISALTAAAILFGAFCSFLLASSIVRPIRQALGVAETVASGDLTMLIEASSNDETGALLRALRNMNDSLVAIVSQVRGATDTIATASGEISSGNLDLSARTEQQASSLEETAASMEELTSTVRQNADNARQANQLSIAASGVAAQGGAVVSQVIETMGSINDSSRKIVDIISVIDGIAFQTNILALNAAVEAARAGEQGRGFAVVASEVRTLAQRSAAAAKEIKELIGDSVGKVDAGARLVDQAGSTMSDVVTSIRRVTDIMAEITSASQEQTAGIEQVNQAIGEMDGATQQNAALVEQSAAAAASLQDQASRLAQVVSVFKVAGVDAAKPVRPAFAATPVRPARAVAQARVARGATALPAAQPKRTEPAVAAGNDWEEF
ncbi:MAG: methyl-accepting chemotaxis protein [Massilia sp.]